MGRPDAGQLQAQRFGKVRTTWVKQTFRELILLCACGGPSEKIGHSSGKENGHERFPERLQSDTTKALLWCND